MKYIDINDRQLEIIDFAKERNSFQNKDIVSFFDNKFSRETIVRDLSFLYQRNILTKDGAGAFLSYSLSKNYDIIKKINLEDYFKTPYSQRDVIENFNFIYSGF